MNISTGKNLHVNGHRVNWSDHSDALVVGPALEQMVAHIREALLDMNSGKLTMFSCLQVVAMEVFTQKEIAEYAAAEQARATDVTSCESLA